MLPRNERPRNRDERSNSIKLIQLCCCARDRRGDFKGNNKKNRRIDGGRKHMKSEVATTGLDEVISNQKLLDLRLPERPGF